MNTFYHMIQPQPILDVKTDLITSINVDSNVCISTHLRTLPFPWQHWTRTRVLFHTIICQLQKNNGCLCTQSFTLSYKNIQTSVS